VFLWTPVFRRQIVAISVIGDRLMADSQGVGDSAVRNVRLKLLDLRDKFLALFRLSLGALA
jgi:hypothetical protein